MPELIAYFSRAGENYVNGNILNLSVGNTELAAKIIQEVTGADYIRLNRFWNIPKIIQNVWRRQKRINADRPDRR